MQAKFYSFLLVFLSLIYSYHSPLMAQGNSTIDVVVFDFSGVIAKSNKQELAQFVSTTLEISSEQALDALALWKSYTKGGGKDEDFWVTHVQLLGKELPENWIEQFDVAQLKALKEIPGMIQLVKNLQEQGFQTAMLSNVKESTARIKRQLGFYDLFDPLLLSYQIGAKKPTAKAYEILLNRLNVPADRILFIDNKSENIVGAQAFGIDGIQFINTEQLIEELEKRGIHVVLETPVP